MQNKVTKKQMEGYWALVGRINFKEEQIKRCEERATECVSKLSLSNVTANTHKSDKVGNNAVEKTRLEQELSECREQISKIDLFMQELRDENPTVALAMEIYYMSEEKLSLSDTYDRLMRYMPRDRVLTVSNIQRSMEMYFACEN